MTGPLTVLLRSHVAVILGVSDRTVSDFLQQSKPGGRYHDNPMPEPAGYQDATSPTGWVPATERRPGLRPFWSPDQADALKAWRSGVPARRRPRASHWSGRP